jgi:hypothetical protein
LNPGMVRSKGGWSGDRQAKSIESVYGDEVCRAGGSRVVRTTELQGTT